MEPSIKLTDLEKRRIVTTTLETYVELHGYEDFNRLTEDDIIDALDESMLNITGDYVSYHLDAETRRWIITEIFNRINNFCKETLENNARLMQQLLA